MKEGRAKARLFVAAVWIIIVLMLAAGYRFLFRPAAVEDLVNQTGSSSHYKHRIRLAADSFSGYAVLRSPEMKSGLELRGIQLLIEDDGADYRQRLRALRDGDVQLAVFTIDSFIANAAAEGECPASIVFVIDETKGADAVVSYGKSVGQIADLNHPDARIVATPNSPSEFLARTVIAHFNLPKLSSDWLLAADGASDVYRQFIDADRNQRRAYVLWEPYVSLAMKESGAKLLLDSGKLKGHIVDVLVAERAFLRDEPELVKSCIEVYLQVLYKRRSDSLVNLVLDDAKQAGDMALDRKQAERLVGGIQWKNTLENYGHFGLVPADTRQGLPHIEDMILNIAQVLLRTGAVAEDPIKGKPNTLFYDRILAEIRETGFHPGKKLNLVGDLGASTADLDPVRSDVALTPLTPEQWKGLTAVGEMRVEPIRFGRGTVRINLQSKRELEQLAKRLEAWPQYYLTVTGHARAIGDPEANQRLAEQRAEAVIDDLGASGLAAHRVRAKAVTLAGRGGDAQSVSFVVSQRPY